MRPIKRLLINFFSRLLFLVDIKGESGWPFLVPGKQYLASNVVSPKVGDFVVFRNPHDSAQILVKRVAAVRGDRYRVESMVSWGTSSDDFGLIERERVIGKIITQNL